MNCKLCKYKVQTAVIVNHIDVFCDYKAIEIHPALPSRFIASIPKNKIKNYFDIAKTPIWCPLKQRRK